MPIYEYECEECHNVTEVSQSIADGPLTTCESCSGPLKKLISMSSFHLKGGGWYADGYSSSKPATPCKSSDGCPATKKSTKTSKSTPPSCPKADGASCCA